MTSRRLGVVVLLLTTSFAACSDSGSDATPTSTTATPRSSAAPAPTPVAPDPSVASTTASPGEEPAPPGLRAAIDAVTSSERLAHADFGFAVLDAQSGEVLYDDGGDTLFVPGSIMKSFTTATLLDAWGPDHRFRTPVYRTGPLEGGVVSGDLVLVASGDMSMGLREQPDGTASFDDAPVADHTYANSGLDSAPVKGDPLTALDSLAQQVVAAGVTSITGDVVVDDRLFHTFAGWPGTEAMPVSPIVINDNRIDVTVTPSSEGQPGNITYGPQTPAYTVRSEVRTVAAGSPSSMTVAPAEAGVFVASGQIAVDAAPLFRTADIPDPVVFARSAFLQALQRAGVDVPAAPAGPNPVERLPPEGSYPADAQLGEHVSAPLAEFTKIVLKTSHNSGANLMACLNAVAVGSKDCPAGLTAAATYAASLGVTDAEAFILDGAGGNGYVTPLAMARLYAALQDQPSGDAFRDSLAVLGTDGDLANQGAGTPAAGRIAAKTGTRGDTTPSGVGILYARTLVGYAEAASGRRIVMAVFMGGGARFVALEDLVAVLNDNTALVVAVQQAF
jgi:D-alanyl-D-alanine carboxypeptidase/D-alanyl-D-alanine-endopeptidase (penicillin-binding protein 4)